MSDYFDINVSKDCKHLFRVDSTTDYENAIEIYREITEKFPKSEGYEVSVTFWSMRGQDQTKGFESAVRKMVMTEVRLAM